MLLGKRKNARVVAEAFDETEAYWLQEGERALVFCLNQADLEICFVEKTEGKLVSRSDRWRIELEEHMAGADERLIGKMKALIGLDRLGIEEADEKNNGAFAELYKSLESVKGRLSRGEETVIVFQNLWLEVSETMTREMYKECMLPLYRFCVDAARELQAEYAIDRISKIYLAGEKSSDSSLWEYLEEQYDAALCILEE